MFGHVEGPEELSDRNSMGGKGRKGATGEQEEVEGGGKGKGTPVPCNAFYRSTFY